MNKKTWELIFQALPSDRSSAVHTTRLHERLKNEYPRGRRSLARHLDEMRLEGVAECVTPDGNANSPTATRYWFRAGGAKRPVHEDALMAQMSEQHAVPSGLETDAARALGKRQAWARVRDGDPLLLYARSLDLGAGMRGAPRDELWRPLRQALFERRVICARLLGRNGGAGRELLLEPRFVKARPSGWILVASVLNQGPNGIVLNLNGFVSITLRGKFEDEGLGVEAYRSIAEGASPVSVEETEIFARATPRGLQVIGSLSRKWTKITESGSLAEVRFSAVPSHSMLDTLMACAGDIAVTAPQTIRDELEERVRRAFKAYCPPAAGEE